MSLWPPMISQRRVSGTLTRWAAVIFMAIFPLAGSATNTPSRITVVLDNNYPPYIFQGKNGNSQGILKDLWSLWSKKTGIHVDFRPMQWDRALAAIKSGHADVIDTIFDTHRREKYLSFSAPYSSLDVNIFFRKNLSGITNANSLQGFTVGVKSGDACIDYLTEHGINTFKKYPSYNREIEAAVQGEIKVMCIDKPPAIYLLNRLGKADDFRYSPPLYVGNFHWAVAKGRPGLKHIIETGFSKITPEEREAIYRDWVGQEVPVTHWVMWVIYSLAVLLLIVILLVLWNWLLRSRVTERTRKLTETLDSLKQSEQKLLTILDNVDANIYLKDVQGNYLFANAALRRLFRAEIPDIVGSADEKFYDMDTAANIRANDRRVLVDGETLRTEETSTVSATDKKLTYQSIKLPLRRDDGSIYALCGISVDITARKQAEELAKADHERMSLLLEYASDGIYGVDTKGICTFVNKTCLRMHGYEREEELVGKNIHSLIHHTYPDGRPYPKEQCHIRLSVLEGKSVHVDDEVSWRRDGSFFPVEYKSHPMYRDGELVGAVVSLTDISERKQAEEKIEHMAYHDQLTALPNRSLFLDRLSQILVVAQRAQRYGAVIFIDLDQFKMINDVYGHGFGDAVLKQVASRLQYVLRQGDTVARFGGDEFVILLPELSTDQATAATRALLVGEKLRKALEEPGQIEGQSYSATASIGISLFPRQTETVDDLIREADIAMYRAKERGRNTLILFEDDMHSAIAERFTLEQELREAIGHNQLELFIQSQVNKAGLTIGGESLVRWRHPTRGLVPPAVFIPLAEETGLIGALGEWVLRETCNLIVQLNTMGQSLRLAVNVSPRQFHQVNFVSRLKDILAETGADPVYLTLEITENLLIERTAEVVSRMLALAELGIRFSIDDFGTGYSSLSYLKRLPLNELKIDKSFVQDIPHDSNDVALVETILSMTRHLGFEVVAEGVETDEQFEFLAAHQCDHFQGYFFHRPQPASEWFADLDDKIDN